MLTKRLFPPVVYLQDIINSTKQMGLTVVKENFFSPWLVTALLTQVLPFINTFNPISAPSRFLRAKLLKHLSAF